MKVSQSFFLSIFFALTFSAIAQQTPFNGEENASWKGETRPNIGQTMKLISEWHAQGKSPAQISELLNKEIPDGGTGVISGTLFQSDGQTPILDGSYINVYDQHGFFEGSHYISGGDTTYLVGNLAAGMHYVQAYSNGNYLNAFYTDAEDWRAATLVQTFDDSTTYGIDFWLDLGKVITGKVLRANFLDPLVGASAYFYLYNEDALLDQDYSRQFYDIISADGSYSLAGIRPGNYKLKVIIEQYAAAFYNNQTSIETADIIHVPAGTDSVQFINFLMNTIVGVQDGYEPNDVLEDAQEFSIGETLTPQINPAGDSDFFSFTANQGDSLDFSIEAQSIGSRLYPYLTLYNSLENVINSWISPNINVQNYVMPDSGRYFLRVTHQNNQEGGDDFFYNLSVNYHTPVTPSSAYISGHVYLEDGSTPYSGDGFFIQVYEKDGNYYDDDYFTDPVYVFDGIPAGIYHVSISAPEQGYLNEWYEDAATMLEATEITIADQDSITDIDFVLDPSGGISGRIFLENYLNDYTEGGYIWLNNSDSPYLSRSYYIAPDPEGLFLASGVRPGDYTLRFDPMSYEENYPSVWYGDVGSQGQATPITVTAADTTDNILMIVKRGGLIQGFITIAGDAMTPVSSDSLFVFVNPYDEAGFTVSSSGPNINILNKDAGIIIRMSRAANNTFSGGYRTSLLYPGFYKLQVLPQSSTLSSWYYPSGSHFDDPGSQMVEVKSDSLHEVPVTLDLATGGISGIVNRADGSTPTSKPGIVYAYDATGHMVQSAVIGLDPQTGQLLDNGHYLISGLTSGTYYVMLSFNNGLNDARERFVETRSQVEKVAFERLFGGNIQNWYPEILVENPFADQLFFLPIPDGAMAVNVTGSSITDGINFTDRVSSISIGEKIIIADNFEISAVYPNPFNPVTTISYNVPTRDRIRIDIFDIIGRKVATLLDEIKSPGKHNIKWNGKNNYEQTVSSGIYIVRLQAAGILSSKKMIFIR